MSQRTKTSLSLVDEYVAIDTETTGLDTKWCELIEVSAVRYKNGTEVESYSSLVKPDTPISDFITELTGITNGMLEDAPKVDEVIPSFLAFVGDSPVVGHNICFDAKFIDKCSRSITGESFGNTLIDTLRISRWAIDDIEKRNLGSVLLYCEKHSGNAFDAKGAAHRALFDAKAAAFCYEYMKPIFRERFGDKPKSFFSNKNSIDFSDLAPTVDEIDESNPFYGLSICFTGKLSRMTRNEAAQCAVNLGAVPQKSVTKKLDYLVVGSFDFTASIKGEKSAKLKKAEEMIVKGASLQIVSEDFFMEYVE